ncbi:MAG: GLPGLI family protein [Ferruginibacter sp.]|nr:GLPGLI family protein [Ferruginibacter sp.]
MAQKTYKVEFSHNKVFKMETGEFKNYSRTTKMFFNDSALLYYGIPNGSKKDKYGNKEIVGENLIHHGIFYTKNDNALYDEIAWPENTNVLLKRAFKDSLNWVFTEQYKSICNYKCKMAYAVSNLDTIMVWYNSELGTNFGPFYFCGLPGVVLEVVDQTNTTHIYAKKIEETSQVLVFPKKNNGIITNNEFFESNKSKQGNTFRKITNITIKKKPRTFY